MKDDEPLLFHAGLRRMFPAVQPRTLAVQHGSSFRGNCAQPLRDLAVVYKDVLGHESFKMARTS